MMERENLGLCNELELSSIPAFQALGSTTVKKRAKKKKNTSLQGWIEKLNKICLCAWFSAWHIEIVKQSQFLSPLPLSQCVLAMCTVLSGRDTNINKK